MIKPHSTQKQTSTLRRLRQPIDQKTFTASEPAVSVGSHRTQGIPDARYLALADQMLGGSADSEGEPTVAKPTGAPQTPAEKKRQARGLLHYRQ